MATHSRLQNRRGVSFPGSSVVEFGERMSRCLQWQLRNAEDITMERHSHWSRLLTIVLALAPGAAPSLSEAGNERVFYYDVDLILRGAQDKADLVLFLGYRDGKWRPYVMGFAGTCKRGRGIYNYRTRSNMDHEGQVLSVEENNGVTTMDVDMRINPDPWTPGGSARYAMVLIRDGNSYTGAFEGTWFGRDVKGTIDGSIRDTLWPSPMQDWVPLEPGEHPRLIFRKSFVPELRKRAETPEGQVILERMQALLEGRWTLWHGVGYGLLYQVTGDRKYADLAREAVDKARDGTPNPDGRYGWVAPNGKLRAGPSYAGIALAYDLCYDSWDRDYREPLARAIQRKVINPELGLGKGQRSGRGGAHWDLTFHTGGGQHDSGSNHFCAWNGGGGLAILAILGDPGPDQELVQRAHRLFMRRAKRGIRLGYSEKAFFWEGHHCGRLSSNTGLVQYLQGLRVALGLDFVVNCPAAQWLCTKWIYELTSHKGKLLCNQVGMYAGAFGKGGMSGGGDFCQGFGIATEAHRAAIHWFHENVFEPQGATYDVRVYPHYAAYALANWPIGETPAEPGATIGHVIRDADARRTWFRNTWSGDSDVVIINGVGATTMAFGEKHGAFPLPPVGEVTGVHREGNGSLVVVGMAYSRNGSEGNSAVAIETSGASGAPVLIVGAYRQTRTAVRLVEEENTAAAEFIAYLRKTAGTERNRTKVSTMSIAEGRGGKATIKRDQYAFKVINAEAPLALRILAGPDGQMVGVGKRTVRFDGKMLVFGNAPTE